VALDMDDSELAEAVSLFFFFWNIFRVALIFSRQLAKPVGLTKYVASFPGTLIILDVRRLASETPAT